MKLQTLAMALTVASAALAGAAFAGDYTVTFQGVVDGGAAGAVVDAADLFGGGDLSGDLVTASFIYDPVLGSRAQAPGIDEATGGSNFDVSAPISYVAFTINGYTYGFQPDYYADLYTQTFELPTFDAHGKLVDPGRPGLVEETAYSTSFDQALVLLQTLDAPSSLSTPFTGINYLVTGSYFNPGATNTGSYDSITFDTFRVDVAAAPEPQSWALFLGGTGLLGWRLRRRRGDGAVSLSA